MTRMPMWAWRDRVVWDSTLPSCVCADCQEEGGGCDECEACQLEADYLAAKKEGRVQSA